MSSGFRVSIPSGVRRTIQNIKEIAGNHSDDEVYAMLRECGMDPNETTQKLLLQDPFHEVKRKRDKRKENYREPGDSRWRSGMLGRGGRGGRGSYSSRYAPNDAGGGRDVSAGKEIGVNQGTDKGNSSSSPTIQAMGNKFPLSTSSSEAGITIGPTNVDYQTSEMCTTQVSGASGIASTEESSASETKKADSTSVFSVDVKGGSASGQSAPTNQFASDVAPTSVSRVYAPTSDPVLVPSFDELIPGAVGAIQREVGSQQTVVETITCKVETSVNKGTCQAVPSSPLTGSNGSRPSSNNSNRPQQLNGPHKAVGPSKEWKPKSTSVNPAQPSGILGTSDVVSITAEALDRSLPSSSSVASDVTTLKLEDLQLLETQHVVIPHHLQVPESERHGLTFGSFDASFKLSSGFANSPASEDSSTPSSELSQVIQENVEEPSSSIHNESPTAHEVDSPDHSQTPAHIPDAEVDVSSGISAVPEHQSKAESSLAPEGLESSVVHTAPTYSTFGLVPQILGSQFAPFGSTEAQPSEATRLPSFVVQQPFDPSTSYYTQIYRPSADSDGRFSPFLAPGAATKYNGNVPVLPGQTGQSPQESGNFLVLSSAGPTPTQPAGIMQNSISVAQQPVPVFRQHGGVHISHYPPNYIPYNQYYSPFYVPPPTLHHFLSNAAFPQQPPTGSIYPPPAAASAAAAGPVKYPISPYKPGTNTVNSNQFGMPTVYGTYNSSPTGYSPSPAVTGGNSTGNEDLTASQYKENNLYITGQQQSEGSAVWIPGRDISSLQVNPFYNLPPQGQHMTFAPTQAGHGALAGVYHPTQTVPAAAVHPLLQQSQTMTGAGEVAGPPAGVYQHPQQRSQINWGNNY